ncbi:putative C-type lectin domain family 20 member A [Psammomys obesus]|uniref:putative C-type lectin domain family 20 member A n=1 Tax=Psammomys obesus TaxID=48139 RepID=UPI00245334A0|nr:putative C-type lectin domain family 20 member A [Psammomys obesus]
MAVPYVKCQISPVSTAPARACEDSLDEASGIAALCHPPSELFLTHALKIVNASTEPQPVSAAALALQLLSSSKTFSRVEEPWTWKEALRYCREYCTDLADLESINSLMDIMEVYSYTSGTQAWIGLFYDMRLSDLSWSSGSTFTIPTWVQDGICATLYSRAMFPALGAASCTDQKPFICYYDPAVGHRSSSESSLKDLTTLPEEAKVKIGGQIFIRIVKQTMSWLLALNYCRNHYTDLADLQRVTDEDREALQSITSDVDAWIGLYFNIKINLTWSSDLGSSVPEWLQPIPIFGQGLCAGLRTFANHPQIYAVTCHTLMPFICFYDPSIGHRKSAEMPSLIDTSSHEGTHPSRVTTRTTSWPNAGTGTGPIGASQALVSATGIPQRVSHGPMAVSSATCGFSTCDTTSTATTTVGLTSLQPQGKISLSPLTTPAPSGAVTSTEGGTHIGAITITTQTQHMSLHKYPEYEEKPPAAESEHSFGILKADFTIPTLGDPGEMKDQLLSEIQEALKLILGHEEFTLKWIGFEVNKN